MRRIFFGIIPLVVTQLVVGGPGVLNTAAGQGLTETFPRGICEFQVKGFERVPSGMHWITAKFISKPAIDADPTNLKTYIIYSRLLGSALTRQLSKTSKHRCSFGAEVDPSLDLRFELYSIGNKVHDECSLNLCAQSLSELIQSIDIDQRIFSNAVSFVLEADRRYTSFDFRRSPLLSALPAVSEVYRHIYPAGSIQRIARDTSEHDFLKVSFEEFVGWFKQQQSRLGDIEQGRGEPPRDARVSTTLPAHPGERKCMQARNVDVQEIEDKSPRMGTPHAYINRERLHDRWQGR
jgi:hypothetical protein